jgi:hypothetical protein
MALQCHAATPDKPSPSWRQFSRVLAMLALAAVPVGLYFGDIVGIRVAIGAWIIAAPVSQAGAGLALLRAGSDGFGWPPGAPASWLPVE